MNNSFIPLSIAELSFDSEILDITCKSLERKTSTPIQTAWLLDQMQSDKKILSDITLAMENLRKMQSLTQSRIECIQSQETCPEITNLADDNSSPTKPYHTAVFETEVKFLKLADINSWCMKCFTSQPCMDKNNAKIVIVHETVCSHCFCSDCISTMLRESSVSRKDVQCPVCKITLLKLF